MKSKLTLILILVLALKLNLHAQKRVPDGQFTSAYESQLGDLQDSIEKYDNIFNYYDLYTNDDASLPYYKLLDYFLRKKDSVTKVVEHLKRENTRIIQKKKLETKYHIILP